MRYYETESLIVDETDFTNYRRKDLSNTAIYGDKLNRFSRTNSSESWAIITYIIDNVFYKSAPIKLQNKTKSTEWLTEVEITELQSLLPKFTWTDGTTTENDTYLQIVLDAENTFLSGTFTTAKTFQYGVDVISELNTETPPDLILGDNYNFTLMGISNDNWVNLVIQKSFTVE